VAVVSADIAGSPAAGARPARRTHPDLREAKARPGLDVRTGAELRAFALNLSLLPVSDALDNHGGG